MNITKATRNALAFVKWSGLPVGRLTGSQRNALEHAGMLRDGKLNDRAEEAWQKINAQEKA